MMSLEHIGKICRDYRKSINKTQADVANDTGYSKYTVSWFENGRNNNALILFWYFENGLEVKR